MAVRKAEVGSARVPPDENAALSDAGEVARRSVAPMLEVIVFSHCCDHGIITPPVNPTDQRHTAASSK